MNITELDLDLDGVEAMRREEARQRAWHRTRGREVEASPVVRRPGESRRPNLEPAWD